MNSELHSEVSSIERMLSHASTHGLLQEVVEAYLSYRGAGDSVVEAVRCALYDWDL